MTLLLFLASMLYLNLTISGHYCISILPSQILQSISEVFTVKLEEILSRSIFLSLHRQFGHAPEEQLKAVLEDAGVYREVNVQIT